MRCTPTSLAGMYLIEPRVFRDQRGSFLESWNEERYRQLGIVGPFVQDNASVSTRGVLRGLHYQSPHAQGKLVSVLEGEVFDVAVDLRAGSPTYGRWSGHLLSAENGHQLYIPEGLAHGFVTLSQRAVFSYKCTDYYTPAAERTLLWNDPDVGVDWPVADPILSDKDRAGLRLAETEPVVLPG